MPADDNPAMAHPNHTKTRIQTLGFVAIALIAMIAFALAGDATSDARAAPSGVHHQSGQRHHHRTRGHHANRTASTVSTASSASDPLMGEHFYWNPADSAVVAERQLVAEGQTAEAAEMQKIASHPEATWLTTDSSTSVVPQMMTAAAAAHTVPVFVAYDIPDRDCGGYSSGGAADTADYESYINSLVSDLAGRKAIVVVEPDALSDLSCQSSSEQQSYYQMIGYAVQQIDTDANANVYVDAGNPTWQPAATEAAALQEAIGSSRAGFSVNVSNFSSAATSIAYGDAISKLAGGRHFVIDTSRAGASVATGVWCNPAGAKMGHEPTAYTNVALLDAYLWVKDLGESDGTCNGGPAAGQFWLSYALSLVV